MEKGSHHSSQKSQKSNTKFIITVIATVIITLLIAGLLFVYLPQRAKATGITDYKRDLYSSVLCQYSCPLANEVYMNVTQLLPEKSCVQACAATFTAKNYSDAAFAPKDLQSDSLINDMALVINQCKKSAVIPATTGKNETFNNTMFFGCSSQSLGALKDKYSYLN